jgi:hypothetical protein
VSLYHQTHLGGQDTLHPVLRVSICEGARVRAGGGGEGVEGAQASIVRGSDNMGGARPLATK